MKRLLCFVLAAMLMFTCACGNGGKPGETEEVKLADEPLAEGTERWLQCTERRYNMDYDDLAGYWSVLTDEYFGDSLMTVVSILGQAENPDFDAAAYVDNIANSKAYFADEYGDDWHYELSVGSQTALTVINCSDFANELEELYKSANVLVSNSAQWEDADWADFAESLGISLDDAKSLVAAYEDIGAKCHEAKVTAASEISLDALLSGAKLESPLSRTDVIRVYEVNGMVVSETLIDAAISLINLVY